MSAANKLGRWFIPLILIGLLAAAGFGLYLTRPSAVPIAKTGSRRPPLVDEQPIKTARAMAALASRPEEQRLARQALRLADQAVDLAFSDAMREAASRPAPTDPATKELFAHVSRADEQVKTTQGIIDDLKKEAASAKGAHVTDLQTQLDLMQAQLELDQDELNDAKGDLFRSGADALTRIQRQFARYQASQQQSEAQQAQLFANSPATPAPADNLVAQFKAWRTLRGKSAQLEQARAEALANHNQLQEKHGKAESQSGDDATPDSSKGQASTDRSSAPADSSQAVIAALRRLASKQKNLADLDKRIQDHQDLADLYGNWMAILQADQQAILHQVIRSLLFILLIVLVAYFGGRLLEHLLGRITHDKKRLQTLRVVARFILQAVALLLIVMVVFGVPDQLSTILGLAGAGLTVALKDFIVAFFGWFVLMGRNGIRVGDWVEINGVTGEVVEVGLLRTVLLETGNWNDAGHPTGRQVAIMNGFAIEGHFFNFSTSGQWLWDELQVEVPASENPYPVIDAIQKVVTDETSANARNAEEEWRRATNRGAMQSFSAVPAVNVRPTGSGVQVLVRYITRAHERYEMRARLYQAVVGVMHGQRTQAAPSS